jgi:hypothetical protein
MQTPEAKAAIDMMDEGRRRKDPALVAQGQRTLEQLSEQAYREAGIPEPKSGIKSIQTPPPATPPAEKPPAAAAPTVPPPADKTGAAGGEKG